MIFSYFTKNKKLIVLFIFFIFIVLYSLRKNGITENFVECARNPACFDKDFDCKSCCDTGRSAAGYDCWDSVYNKDKCCMNSDNSCAKNDQCFGGEFSCESCCNTGLSDLGTPCWNDVYTQAKCCNNPSIKSTPSPTDTCAKDPACFDKNFDCKSCCDTGRSAAGYDCWDSVYNKDKCCMNTSLQSTPPSPTIFQPPSTIFQPPPPIYSAPTITNPTSYATTNIGSFVPPSSTGKCNGPSYTTTYGDTAAETKKILIIGNNNSDEEHNSVRDFLWPWTTCNKVKSAEKIKYNASTQEMHKPPYIQCKMWMHYFPQNYKITNFSKAHMFTYDEGNQWETHNRNSIYHNLVEKKIETVEKKQQSTGDWEENLVCSKSIYLGNELEYDYAIIVLGSDLEMVRSMQNNDFQNNLFKIIDLLKGRDTVKRLPFTVKKIIYVEPVFCAKNTFKEWSTGITKPGLHWANYYLNLMNTIRAALNQKYNDVVIVQTSDIYNAECPEFNSRNKDLQVTKALDYKSAYGYFESSAKLNNQGHKKLYELIKAVIR